MAMDPELRAYLEAMEKRSDAKLEALKDKIEEARREARVLHEDTWKKIDALGEGLSTRQRDEADRLDAAREEAMLNQHILPLEASAANHEKRIKAVEMKQRFPH